MPKNTYNKEKQRRKAFKKTYPKTSSAISLANKALRAIKYMQGMINCEKHKMEFSDITGPTIANTGTIYHLTGVAQDDTDSGRTGNSLLARGLYYSYTIRNSGSPPAFSTVRVMIIQDMQQISDLGPTNATGLLEYPSGPRVVNSTLDSQTVGRWKVLYDKRLEFDTVNKVQHNISGYLPMKHHIRYNGTTGNDIQKGGIYIVFLCDLNAITNPYIYQFQSRLYFYDN